MRALLILFLLCLFYPPSNGDLIDPAYFINNYDEYRYDELKDRQYKHTRHINILRKLTQKNPDAKLQLSGRSFEGREIFSVQWGRGRKKILLWTQMHGNEPTATLAFTDFLNFLYKEQDSPYLQMLADSITILGIPCLNPDGAVRYQRNNAQDTDINRDAIDLKSPEARLLDSLATAFEPIWAFNLHDQSAYYTLESSPGDIHFSFQAPPIDKENTETDEIIEVKQLISRMITQLGLTIDQKAIAKYPIRYSENAFGEKFQQRGIKTLLIETGRKIDDPEKQDLRRMHAAMLIQLSDIIAFNKYSDSSPDIYNDLPECELSFHELIIEHIKIPSKNAYAIKDLGFRKIFKACQVEGKLTPVTYLASIGAPYELKGQRYINGKYSQFENIRMYPDTIQSINDIGSVDVSSLIEKGYFAFMIREEPDSCDLRPDFPFMINETPADQIKVGLPLTFILRGTSNANSYLIHNGYIHDLKEVDSAYIHKRIKYPVNEKDE